MNPNNGPNPETVYPLQHHKKLVFLKNIIANPAIIVGDYTYYDDLDDPHAFERNVLYHFDFIGDKLTIGKFCAIASGVKFIMSGANHAVNGISTFPFAIFGYGWEQGDEPQVYPYKGDTVIGNDIWIGYGATIMPGVKIGNGAIIASQSVVVSDVPDYAVAGGNPTKVIRQRFDDKQTERLLKLAWWDWDAAKISRNIRFISGADIDALEKAK